MPDIAATCRVITALLAYLNHRFVGMPTTIGVMATALAVLGTALSTVAVGFGLWLSLPVGQHLPLMHCLLFGALISPTDPIAVMGILKSADAPKELDSERASMCSGSLRFPPLLNIHAAHALWAWPGFEIVFHCRSAHYEIASRSPTESAVESLTPGWTARRSRRTRCGFRSWMTGGPTPCAS